MEYYTTQDNKETIKITLYIRCCVVPANINDSDGDILTSDEIKVLYKAYNNRDNFELYHNKVLLNDIVLFENYLTKAPEKIGLQNIPIGSWVATVKSDNELLNNLILNNEITGVSLTNIIKDTCPLQPNNKYLEPNYYDYKDLKDITCIQPLSISFVEEPANMIGLHVYDEQNYVIKEKKVQKMSLLEDLKKLLSSYEKEEDATTSEEVEVVEEAVEEVEAIEEEATQEPAEEATEEAESIEKEEENPDEGASDIQAQLDDIYKRLEALEKPSEEEPKIIKKEKKVIVEEKPQETKNYYELAGRDPATGLKL